MARPGDRDRVSHRAHFGRGLLGLAAAGLVALACEPDAGVGPTVVWPSEPPHPVPRVVASAVAPGPANVLSVVVSARVLYADSAAVRFGPAGTTLDSLTPAVLSAADSIVVPVLGLLPDSPYTLVVVAYRGDRTAVGDSLTFQTGPLPGDLPSYITAGPDPSPGYVVFAAGRYGIVIDNTGRVVWYRRFEYGAGLSFAAQPTGHYVARPLTAEPTDPPVWVELDRLGNVTRTVDCARGLVSRLHDLILAPDGSYWLMCDDTRTMDLSAMGGLTNARVTGTAVQHVGADGQLLFSWTPFDHFDLADLPQAARAGATVNWTHGNSLDLDADGNVVVSFRNLSEITTIDTQTGNVLWRMGGLRNQFTFANTSAPAFSRQHGLRLTDAGRLLLLDNYGDSLDSRAERYVFDADLRVASLVTSYGPTPAVTADLGGSAQDLPDGRTLVSFGTAGRVEEYAASGQVVWRIEGAPGYIFRAQRIRSLYAPGVGLPR
jgi:hypothetical protein